MGRLALAYRRFMIHRRILRSGMRHAHVNHAGTGLRWSYYYRCSGRPPLVLLHGFLDSSHTWRRLFAALSERYDLYAVDVPGFGSTALPPVRELWRIQAFARNLGRFLFDESGLDLQNATILSHSMGGMIAAHLVRQLPLITRRRPGTAPVKELHLIAPGFVKLSARERDERRRTLFPRTPAEVRELLRRLYSANLPELGLPVILGLLEEWSQPGYHYLAENTIEDEDEIFFRPAEVGTLGVPVSLYWGDDDGITGIELARRIVKAAPQIRLAVIPGAGHALHLDRTEEMLAAFLENADRAPALRRRGRGGISKRPRRSRSRRSE